jgi:hypothetical protein
MPKSMFRICIGNCMHSKKHFPHGVILREGKSYWAASPPFYSKEEGFSTLNIGIKLNNVLPEDEEKTRKDIEGCHELPTKKTKEDIEAERLRREKELICPGGIGMFIPQIITVTVKEKK